MMLFGKKLSGWIAIAISVVLAVAIVAGSVLYTPKMAVAKQPTISASRSKPKIVSQVKVSENETKTPNTGAKAVEEPQAESQAPEWNFFNLELQENGNDTDDYNFGPNPIFTNISLEKVEEAIKGKSGNDTIKVSELFSEVEVEEIDKDFRNRLKADPALGAADMAWADSLLGTRYLGVFYDECDEKWDAAMNAAKEAWIEDYEDYYDTLDAFYKFLDSATKVEIEKVEKRLDDQMYMNPYTKDGIPDIIVMESTDHDGYYLCYTFTIKDTKTVKVAYRVDCGYQPTNVAKIMKIKAKKRGGGGGGTSGGGAAKTGGGVIIAGGGGGTSGGGGNPKPNPNPNPNPNPPYNKDNSKGTSVIPNDTSGPGEDTNGNTYYSSKDLVGNSNDLTPEEYKETIQEMKDANTAAEAAQKASESGGATTPPPTSDTTVDNPGASDSGYTETSSSEVSNDPPADSWDGPADAD